jgi:hypothetical protein
LVLRESVVSPYYGVHGTGTPYRYKHISYDTLTKGRPGLREKKVIIGRGSGAQEPEPKRRFFFLIGLGRVRKRKRKKKKACLPNGDTILGSFTS